MSIDTRKIWNQPLFVLSLLLGLMVPGLIFAGVTVHGLLSQSLSKLESVERSSHFAAKVLQNQLDQETGMRGYAATHKSIFLAPYISAERHVRSDFDRLSLSLTEIGLTSSLPTLEHAYQMARLWHLEVAQPIILAKHYTVANNTKLLLTQYQGKLIVDRFRHDIGMIDQDLARLRMQVTNNARTSVDRILEFVLVAVVCLMLLGLAFMVAQHRLSQRLNAAWISAEEERQRTRELQAALATEKRIAEVLQDALSQRPLPALANVQFSAMYMPAEEDAKIGGDWYDAIELTRNRALFVIGDVAGHGFDAAVQMSKVRQSLISAALRYSDPAHILQHVNRELTEQGALMVTAVCGIADAVRCEFMLATAGHPPAVLVEPGRAPRMLSCGGLPLGIIANAEYQTAIIQTVPGAMLVLYTDGAVEHSHSVLDGEQLLLKATEASVAQAHEEPAKVIHRNIFNGRSAGDDVAILTIGFSADVATHMDISAKSARYSFKSQLQVDEGDVKQPQNAMRPTSLAWFKRKIALAQSEWRVA